MASKRDKLYEKVDNAINLNDLIPILSTILQHPLNTIQTLIQTELKKCDDNKINKLFYETYPMTEILPNEMIQQILSYDQYSLDNRLVNKSFKNASDNNDKIELKQRKTIVEHESNINIKNKYFSDSITSEYWIVDQNRAELNDKEISSKYKGPINNIMDAIKKCKSGDTLLIYDGIYEIDDDTEPIGWDPVIPVIDKKISFIGMGSNIIFKQFVQILVQNDVYFKNICFDCEDLVSDYMMYAINAGTNGNIWMEHCKMALHCACCGVFMKHGKTNTSIYLAHCEFINVVPDDEWCGVCAVSISAEGNSATILCCKFTNFGKDNTRNNERNTGNSITIHIQSIRDKHIFNPKIRIIGNEIVNDDIGKAIAFCTDDGDEKKNFNDWFIAFGSYEIKNNLINGKNSIFTNLNDKLERRNPNKIYHVSKLKKI